MPFWSWNGFLGLNFWASKTYYLIGDPYAWLSVPVHLMIKDVPKVMSLFLLLKFIITYTSFFVLTKYWKIQPIFRILLSLAYTFSGWNLIFMEQVMYTSFYSLIPLLLITLEIYFKNKHGLFISISVALLVSINFYLFWVASWLFLIYYIYRYLQEKPFIFKEFFSNSLKILLHFILGVFLTSFVWLPGVIHLLQSSRVGTFLNDYSTWNQLQLSSLLTFTFIPSLKYLDGLFKDKWYYFNQLGLYIGVFTILIIPQAWFVLKQKKERLLSLLSFIVLILLLISPKVGLFFHFTYSLRYTLIHTVIFIFLGSISLKAYKEWNIWVTVFTQLFISILFIYLIYFSIPNLYPTLPNHIEEISLLKMSFLLTWVYTIIIIAFISFKSNHIKNIIIYLVSLCFIFEMFVFSQSAFKSQEGDGLVYYTNEYFQKALNYVKENDPKLQYQPVHFLK